MITYSILAILRKLILIKILFISTYAKNYLIRGGTDTIYFEHNFTKLNGDFLSKPLKINMTLSTTKGIILYSLDKKENQFILSIDDLIIPTINVEYNGNVIRKPLSEFCQCKMCTNEPLVFEISINGVFLIECNGQKINMTYKGPKLINKMYPIFQIKSPCEVRLWLVNTPQHGNLYPSNNQLSGCIFDILYGDEPIYVKRFGNSKEENCTNRCNKHLCNDGKCVENYGMEPICNCSNTFENGKYCNESMKLDNGTKRIFHNANFMFKKTMISWKGASNEIFTAKNKKFTISIYSIETSLKLQFEDRTENLRKVECILMKNYTRDVSTKLTIWFEDQIINVNLVKTLIPINHKLENEIFDTIEIYGPSAYVIRVTYLNDEKWNDFNINSLKYMDELILEPRIPIENPKNISIPTQQSMHSDKWKYSIMVLLAIICVTESIIIILRKKLQKLLCNSSGTIYELTSTIDNS